MHELGDSSYVVIDVEHPTTAVVLLDSIPFFEVS